jgi:hypothetical protein
MTRELARWATPGRRRFRPVRGLARDLGTLFAQARWSPAPVATDGPEAAPPGTAPIRPGSLRGYLAPVAPDVQVDGPRPAVLPVGPVILVANHPTPRAADLVLSRLSPDRRSRTVLVAGPFEQLPALTRLARPLVRLDPQDPGRAGARLRDLLGQGWSALIFPEGEPAAGAVNRPFHPFAAELAAGLGLPVVPVGIRGARAVGAHPGPARVSVRFGEVLPEGVDARAQEAAVEALIAEDRATWWAVQRAGPAQLPSVRPPHSAHSWRHVWAQTAHPTKGGTLESPRIWR